MTSIWSERARDKAKELKLSDAQIAKMIGWSHAAVNGWMNGSREPKLEQKMAIAGALSVSVHWLETGEEEELSADYLPAFTMDDLEALFSEIEAKEKIFRKNPGIRIVESSENSFLVVLDNDTMIDPGNSEKKHIPEGSVVQIDRDYKPAPGDIILVEHDGMIMLRLWKRINEKLHHLWVINPLFAELKFTHNGFIEEIYKGTAVGCSQSLV